LGYSTLILFASLAGGWVPFVARLTHTRTQLLMSFVAGMMLGVGVFHMLPHAVSQIGSLDRAVWWMMVGLLAMFFLQRVFHFHQHGPGDVEAMESTHASHDHDHDHAHDHDVCQHAHGSPGRNLHWLGVCIGLTLHSLMDGIALAASVEVEAQHAAGGLLGLGTFLAVLLHKPLDAMAITTLMVSGNWPIRTRHMVNVLFALVLPVGVVLFYLGAQGMPADQRAIIGCALAFSAGNFLCISLSDLLPELQFHTHDRLNLSIALLLGIGAAYAIGYFETSGHEHHRGQTAPITQSLRPPARETAPANY
jgi:zinc and cadmium transporter